MENLSSGKEHKIHFKVFHYAWSIIDHGNRFSKLYKTLNPSEQSIISRLDYLDIFRNAIQHVDLNLKKTGVKMLDNGRPIYGALKWVVHDSDKKETYTALLISGIFNIKSIEFRQHSQEGYDNLVNDIILETDTLNKKDENEICLSRLMGDISIIADQLGESLNKTISSSKLQKLDWTSRKDVLLKFKNE